MEIREMNERALQMIQEWDPFSIGAEHYELEAVDVVAALHDAQDLDGFAVEIQRIYEDTSLEWIPLVRCKQLAIELFALKMQVSCLTSPKEA